MRTHILLVLTALIVTACASNREVAGNKANNYDNQTQHAQFTDGAASRIR